MEKEIISYGQKSTELVLFNLFGSHTWLCPELTPGAIQRLLIPGRFGGPYWVAGIKPGLAE